LFIFWNWQYTSGIMYKKFLTIGVLTISSLSLAYAHDTGIPHEEPRMMASSTRPTKLVPVSAEGRRPVLMEARGKMMQMASGTISTSSMPGIPMEQMGQRLTTGDPVIDDQIKVLNKEMETKIKALREEYALKIKAIIGDKKLVPRVGSSTAPRRDGDRIMMGSSTERRGEVRGMVTDQEGGKGAIGGQVSGGGLIKNFFKNLLGGGN
jgi:hypothetical protein